MKKNGEIMTAQYTMVRESRRVLLDYCGSLSSEYFTAENSQFGRGSIRNLLVHNANVYQFWIAKKAFGRHDYIIPPFADFKSLSDVSKLYEEVNELVVQFIDSCDGDINQEFEFELGKRKRTASGLKIFTHVITHEFHHKGQILTLSRHFGFTPPDTDVIR